jgi:hypothetical protein
MVITKRRDTPSGPAPGVRQLAPARAFVLMAPAGRKDHHGRRHGDGRYDPFIDRVRKAKRILSRIAQLCAIEKTIRGKDPETRPEARRKLSKPIVDAPRPWLEARLQDLSSASELARHIRYGLKWWDGLTRFLSDGRVEMDTNGVENAIRPIPLKWNLGEEEGVRSIQSSHRHYCSESLKSPAQPTFTHPTCCTMYQWPLRRAAPQHREPLVNDGFGPSTAQVPRQHPQLCKGR